MASKKTLSIGGATYDLFVQTNKKEVHDCNDEKGFFFPLGDKIRIEGVVEASGGGACNTSTGLSRLGVNACLSAVIGSDRWGEKLLENLKKEGVDTDCCTIVEDEVSSFSVILSSPTGERVILYDPGTNAHMHDAIFNRDILKEMDWVYFNHIQAESCVIEDDIIEALTTSNAPRLTWNPGGCQLDAGMSAPNNKLLLAHTDLLILNDKEALRCTKEDSIDDALRALIDAGAGNVCITRGKDGVLASDGKDIFESHPLSSTPAVDTTGAGDAFGTGVTWALLSDFSLKEAIKAGTINASSVVEHTGAQTGLLTETDMRQRLTSTPLEVSVTEL